VVPVNHVKDINNAKDLVETYCSPGEPYGWPLYDDDPAPGILTGVDLASPALVSYPIPRACLNMMGQDGTEYHALFQTMKRFVETPASTPTSFYDLPEELLTAGENRQVGDPKEGPKDWQDLISALDAVHGCKDLWSPAVTKILHRKRPDLVPISDSRVQDFYGARRDYSKLFTAIHADLHFEDTNEWLAGLAADHVTPSGRPMTVLRALDIIVWMHAA